MDQNNTKDQNTIEAKIKDAKEGIEKMAIEAQNGSSAERMTAQLGAYINSIASATAEKVNDMDANLKKTKLAANLAAIISGAAVLGGVGYFVYKYREGVEGAKAMATGEMF